MFSHVNVNKFHYIRILSIMWQDSYYYYQWNGDTKGIFNFPAKCCRKIIKSGAPDYNKTLH